MFKVGDKITANFYNGMRPVAATVVALNVDSWMGYPMLRIRHDSNGYEENVTYAICVPRKES